MTPTELTGAEYWASFWEWTADKAFILVVIFLGVEYIAGRWAKPHKEAIEDARKLQIAQLEKDAAQANERQKRAELELLQLRLPRSLDFDKFKAAVGKIPPPTSFEVLYDANAPDASFLASLIWGIFFNAKWPTQQTQGAAPLKAPPPNVLPYANMPWTEAAGGGPWGLSVVVASQEEVNNENSQGHKLFMALLESVKGPPAQAMLGFQTSTPVSPGAVRIIVGPKTP